MEDKPSNRTQLWSCGGGTQSAGMAALFVKGILPRPDFAVIADTGREKRTTWEYLDRVLRPELKKIGLEIHKVGAAEYATVDLLGLNGDVLMPMFTTQSGVIAKLQNFCSYEWKKRVVQRWAKQTMGFEQVDNWMGISADETRRVRQSSQRWWQLKYPLVFDVRMTKRELILLVESMGWPAPSGSYCWMCPQMSDKEWKNQRDNEPDEFQQAIELERELRIKDPFVYLHKSAMPLDEVVFGDSQQDELFGCNSMQCFV
jgi:hypothetical protein